MSCPSRTTREHKTLESNKSVKQSIELDLAALHGAFHTMPTPFQMDDERQYCSCQTTFILHQAPGHHYDQDHSDAIGRTRGQGLDQTTNGCCRQVYWVGGRVWRYESWFSHTTLASPDSTAECH